MKISETVHLKINEVERTHKNEHKNFEFYKRNLIPRGAAEQCTVAVYEIPPGKSAFPYHYHLKNEESYYIISGQGTIKTPAGEREVKPGEFLFFPANENGAHRLTNSSETEMLTYLDFDTANDLEVAVYPDSGKIGVWGKNINRLYIKEKSVDYYEDE